MRIGIDGNEANVKEQVGVSVYTRKLLEYFQKNADKTTQFRIYLRSSPIDILPPETDYFKYEVVFGPSFWLHLFLPLSLFFKRGIDIFFSPAHYIPRYCPVPIVTTIHDLSYFYYPQEFLKKDLYKLTNWTQFAIQKSAHLIAVSKTTKKDILQHYQVSDSHVTVVYNGFEKNASTSSPTDTLQRFELNHQEYILYVGTLQPRKNITILIESMKKIHDQNSKMKLVLVGKKGWLFDKILKEAEESSLKGSIVFTGYLPDAEVGELYKHAFCYVMPSLYEGFGIPILEAMSHGCPVISSFTSSLPEVGGEACLYFDPHSASDLTDKILQLQQHQVLRQELIKKGKEHVKSFSWDKCGKETLELLLKFKK